MYALWYSWVEVVRALGSPPKRVLDAACGRGIVSQVLHLKGFEVAACDIEDCFMADRAIEFRRVDLNGAMPYASRSCDAIVNCEGLENLESSAHFLREAARVLVPDGKLLLSVPNIQGLAGRYHFFRTGKLAAYDDAASERINVICLSLLKSACERCGFKITRIRGNVPLLTRKIKVFDALFGKRFFKDGDEVLRHAHSLVIECSLKAAALRNGTPRASPRPVVTIAPNPLGTRTTPVVHRASSSLAVLGACPGNRRERGLRWRRMARKPSETPGGDARASLRTFREG